MKRINPALVILVLGALPSSAQAVIDDCEAFAAGNPGECTLGAPLLTAAGTPAGLASDTSSSTSAANNGGPDGFADRFSASSMATATPDSGDNSGHQDATAESAATEETRGHDNDRSGRPPQNDRAGIGNPPPQILTAPDGLTSDHEFVLGLLLDAGLFSNNETEFDTVPEAATVILLGLGLYGIGVARRR